MPRAKNFTDAQIEEALRKAGGIQVVAARMLESASSATAAPKLFSRQAMSVRIKRSKRLQRVLADIREQMLDLAETGLVKGIQAGSETLIKFYLETQGKARGYTRRVEQTGANGGPMEMTTADVTAELTAELDRMAGRIAGGKAGNAAENGEGSPAGAVLPFKKASAAS